MSTRLGYDTTPILPLRHLLATDRTDIVLGELAAFEHTCSSLLKVLAFLCFHRALPLSKKATPHVSCAGVALFIICVVASSYDIFLYNYLLYLTTIILHYKLSGSE